MAACVKNGSGSRAKCGMTHNGQPLSTVSDNKKLCIILAYLFVKLINTTVKHPDYQRKEASTHDSQSPKVWGGSSPPGVDYKHNEHLVGDNPKQRVLCKQKYSAPSHSPFPFSHHGQASCSTTCPWVSTREGGRGWGSVCAAHTQWAAPVNCE